METLTDKESLQIAWQLGWQITLYLLLFSLLTGVIIGLSSVIMTGITSHPVSPRLRQGGYLVTHVGIFLLYAFPLVLREHLLTGLKGFRIRIVREDKQEQREIHHPHFLRGYALEGIKAPSRKRIKFEGTRKVTQIMRFALLPMVLVGLMTVSTFTSQSPAVEKSHQTSTRESDSYMTDPSARDVVATLRAKALIARYQALSEQVEQRQREGREKPVILPLEKTPEEVAPPPCKKLPKGIPNLSLLQKLPMSYQEFNELLRTMIVPDLELAEGFSNPFISDAFQYEFIYNIKSCDGYIIRTGGFAGVWEVFGPANWD